MTHDNRWFWLTIFVTCSFLLYLLSPILTPFLLGAMLAYLADPLVDKLERYNIRRTLAVVIVFFVLSLLLFLVLLFVLPIFETQFKMFLHRFPDYVDWFTTAIQPSLNKYLDVDVSVLEGDRLKAMVGSHWNEAGGIIRAIIKAISQSGLFVIGWLATMTLTPFITFYLLRDWDDFITYIHDLLPRANEPLISQLAHESDVMLGAFLRGQLMVMLALGVIYSFGLWLVGVEFALLLGMFAGFLSFVPYLGLIVGVLIAGAAVLFQTHDFVNVFLVVMVFAIAQAIEGMLLTPLLVGERIGLHPVTVIFAVLAGGQLFGFFGVLLALPIAAVLAVILRHLHDSYKESQLYRL